jgi:choline-sulfatase
MPRRPNVLWIQTDEQRPDSLSPYGSAWARTPHAERLASRGVVMTNALCQSPVCVPSRASQIFCRYPQEIGVTQNYGCNEPQPEGLTPFPTVFRANGYTTASFGKRHMPGCHHVTNHVWDQGHAICQFPEVATYGRLGPGYDERASRVLHLNERRPIIIGGTWPEPGMNPASFITDSAVGFMRHCARPFLVRVSYEFPHSPVLAPRPFDELYSPDDVPIRHFSEEACRGRSRYDQRVAEEFGMTALSRDEAERAWTDYMGLCAFVDRETGRVLEALERFGLVEETIVVFSSDHGRSLGEFGPGQKMTFDDQVWRVPFIWSWPGQLPEGEKRPELCELVDTARTLLALAGLPGKAPPGWVGRDLFGDPAPEAAFGAIGPRGSRVVRVGVRTRRHRMDLDWDLAANAPARDPDGDLFDLEADPGEMRNLFSDPARAGLVGDLSAKVCAWVADHHETGPPWHRTTKTPRTPRSPRTAEAG